MKAYGGTNKSRVVVIPHGNYIDNYENKMDLVQARKWLQLSDEDIVFLFFGSLRYYKGVNELVEAFNKLDVPKAKLLIVGKPSDVKLAGDLTNICKGNKRIKIVLDFIPNNQIQIYMNGSDIVVCPYKNILTSGAIILAMSFGKPIIAPRIGCIPDILDCDGSFLYNPLDKGGLLKAMQLASRANLTRMGKHNFRLAKELKWGDIAKKQLIFMACCETRRP